MKIPCRLPFEESQGLTVIFLIVILKDALEEFVTGSIAEN
jgi:hypothetical protein